MIDLSHAAGATIRDQLIAASLKPTFTNSIGETLPSYPRSIDRGLIEAEDSGPSLASRDIYPRSIDRGLIEAVLLNG